MTRSIRGFYDGRVIVPSEPLDIPRGQELTFRVEEAGTTSNGTPGTSLLHFAGTIDPAEIEVITQAINEGCEQVRADEW